MTNTSTLLLLIPIPLRFSMFNYIASISKDLDTNSEKSGKYTEETYHALNPHNESSAQLWARPLYISSLSTLPCGISPDTFTVALSNFYKRISLSSASVNSNDILVAGRCWSDDEVYTSSLYKSYNNGSERGRHYIMFEVLHQSNNSSASSNKWFVGGVAFFFMHVNAGVERFFAAVNLVDSQSVDKADQYTPLVTLHEGSRSKLVVCQVEEILCSVGLVLTSFSKTKKYKVISHYTHKKSLINTVGAPGLLRVHLVL